MDLRINKYTCWNCGQGTKWGGDYKQVKRKFSKGIKWVAGKVFKGKGEINYFFQVSILKIQRNHKKQQTV